MKRPKITKLTAVLMSALFIISSISFSSFAAFAESNTQTDNDLNIHYLGHFEKNSDNQDIFVYDDETVLIPDSASTDDTLPTKYDLRDVDGKSYVTSVKEQGVTRACWAFGNISAVESNILKQGNADSDSLDLSERHLAWYTYNGNNTSTDLSLYAGSDTYTQYNQWSLDYLNPVLEANNIDKDEFAVYLAGGWQYHAISTLTRGYGVVDETELPFETVKYGDSVYVGLMGAPSDNTQTQSNISVSQAKIFPGVMVNSEYSQKTLDEIKRNLMTNGAMSVSFYTGSMNLQTCAYYNSQKITANHAVCIVGWDDEFSADNFLETPPGNGAFIIKDNYGAYSGDNGYFYISYYDQSMCDITSYIMEDQEYNGKNTKHNYENTYQYDGVFSTNVTSPDEYSSANIFTARADEKLEAVGLSTSVANVKTNLKIYTDVEDGKPESGTLAYNKDLTLDTAGYTTYTLDSDVYVKSGTKYSVVITEQAQISGQDLYLICNEYASYSSIDRTSGRSFIKHNNEWSDVVDGYYSSDTSADNLPEFGGATVKVFTNNAEIPVQNSGWHQTSDCKWQYYENGVAVTGWKNNIPGWNNWFYFDQNGIMLTGWQNNIPGWNYWFYFDISTGAMQTGWKNNIPGWNAWFYFNDNGTMQTGFKNNIPGWEGKYFYFDYSTGVLQIGQFRLNGNDYETDANGCIIGDVGLTLKGIDVSQWQGNNINWQQVRADGVEYVMIRSNYGWTGKDKNFDQNIQGAKAAGLKVGVYLYSYATTVDEAVLEFNNLMSTIKGYDIDFPVAYDLEDETQTGLSVQEMTDIAVTFCNLVRNAGYDPMIYASTNWMTDRLNYNAIAQFKLWVAQYNVTCDYAYRNPPNMWQYTSRGSVNGISGNVDMDWMYL